MQNFDGAPKVVIDVTDASIVATNTKKSKVLVTGITAMGIPGVAYAVSNPIQYRRLLGGYHSQSLFPLYCMRALAAGAQLVVVPVGHYTDITDATTLSGTRATASRSVSGTNAGVSNWSAKAPSEGYNGVTVTVTPARSRAAGKVDIREEKPGVEGTGNTVTDVPQTPTEEQITALNKKLLLVNLVDFTTRIPEGTATLAGAVQPIDEITDTDYIGDPVAKTGLYAFDAIKDARYIANFDRPTAAVDDAIAAYARARKKLRFFLRTPVGLTAEGMVAYRERTGVFAPGVATPGVPIDSFLGNMTAGHITVRNPLDSADLIDISPIADVVGARCTVDFGDGPWFTVAGQKRGRIRNTLGVPYNLGSDGLTDEADAVANAGLNYVIDHETFGPVLWGNASLQRDTSKMLSNDNIANLAVHLLRNLPAFADSEMFDPNDPLMWGQVYRNSLGFIEDLENRRAIRPGEGKYWFWYGDQNVTDLNDLVYNKIEDLDRGIYRTKFLFVPINATKFIGIEATLTDSGSLDLQIIQ